MGTKNHLLYLWMFTSIYISKALSNNTPPHLSFDREWILTEDEPIGSVVSRVQVNDADGDDVTLTLGAPSSRSFQREDDGHSFFKIDSNNKILLAKSLQGMAGESFLVGVIASDGTISNRVDAKVTVRRTNEKVRKMPFSFSTSFDPGPPPPLKDIPKLSFSDASGPPILHLDPKSEWTVRENATVGSVIKKILANDFSNTFIKFDLSPKLLFDIDETSGELFVKVPLLGQLGKHALTIKAYNKYEFITEEVFVKVIPTDPSVEYDDDDIEEDDVKIKNIKKWKEKQKKKEHERKQNSNKNVVTIYEKKDMPKEPAPEEDTLGYTVIWIVCIFGVVGVVLGGLFFLRRWKRSQKVKAEAKESSVSYSEKGGVVERAGSLVTELFSKVGIHNRAESNRYEGDVKIPKVPSRDLTSRKVSIPIVVEKDEWEFSRHKLRILEKLGEGCFGQVWKYEATDLKGKGLTLVAVKTLKESAGVEEQKDLLQELKVLKSLGSHPNVVSLLGCCTEKEPLFVILEYMIGGKLQSYLRASRADRSYDNLHGASGTLMPKDLTIFALQVAKGMDFLSKHGIIHRDLAARNILIGEDKICKVADFGFARDVANNHVYERKSDGRLPIRWMAPESLFDNIFTTKSDGWSYGILLWEIVTLGSTPYPGMSAQEVMTRVKNGYRLEKPDHCGREVYNIMYYCWDVEQNLRPSFSELSETLERLIAKEVDYIRLDNFPEHNYYNFTAGTATGELL